MTITSLDQSLVRSALQHRSVHIKVEQDRLNETVGIVFIGFMDLLNAEVHIVIRLQSFGVLGVVHPANNLPGLGFVVAEHLVDLVQEQVSVRAKLRVCQSLLERKEAHVILVAGLPRFSSPVFEITGIIGKFAGNFDGLFDLLFLAVFVRNRLFDLLLVNIIANLTLSLFAITICNAGTILLETRVQRRISSSQRHITFAKDVITRQDAGDRQSTDNAGRRI